MMFNNTTEHLISSVNRELNQSIVTVGPKDNVTNNDDTSYALHWGFYLEAVFVGLFCIFGIVGNAVILRSSVKTTRFSKRNLYLFFGMSLGDIFVCLVRGPSMIYILLYPSKENGHIVCGFWAVSTIFVVIVILTNMVVAIERIMIMNSFQTYQKLFTPHKKIALNIVIWAGVTTIGVFLFKVLQCSLYVYVDVRACYITSDVIEISNISALCVRIALVLIFAVAPIIVIAICYMSIVAKVCKAGLLRLDRIDEHSKYTRVTYISIARVVLSISSWMPFCIFIVIGSFNPEEFYPYIRFSDYVCVLQSVISPFISIQDTDFKDVRRKWRSCIHIGSKLRWTGTKGSRRSNNITSAEMRSYN